MTDDNEKLHAMEFHLQLERLLPPVGLKPGIARSVVPGSRPTGGGEDKAIYS